MQRQMTWVFIYIRTDQSKGACRRCCRLVLRASNEGAAETPIPFTSQVHRRPALARATLWPLTRDHMPMDRYGK